MSEPLLRVEDLSVRFEVRPEGLLGRRRGVVHAVDRVSFEIPRGETLGLIGESGSGKSTTGRALLRRVEPDAGRIEFKGVDVTHLQGEPLRRLRRHMQMIFQDPYGSLNPRLRVGEIVAEPLLVHGVAEAAAAGERVAELLALVGLPPDAAERHPDAFSGGQRQRIGIARALALEPELIVADEPVSALDVSVRAQVINLLEELQARLGLTYLFIGHDLAVVRRVAHRIAIMYSGRIVELAASRQVYEEPRHPYTRALLAAIPSPGRRRTGKDRRSVVIGEPPDPIAPPPGCRFHPRCPYRQPSRCADEDPALRALAPGQAVACHYAEEIASGAIRARTGDGEQPPRPRPQTPPRQGATTNRSDIEHDQND